MSYNFDTSDTFNSFEMFSSAIPEDGCTQCGICLPHCPTYLKTSDPSQSPMGRIRIMRQLDSHEISDLEVSQLESCLGCYGCEAICPSKVTFGNNLDESLAKLRQQHPLPRLTKAMLMLATKRITLKHLLKISFIADKTGIRQVLEKIGLIKLCGLQRANAVLGKFNFPTALINKNPSIAARTNIALFTGCFSSVLEQNLQQTVINLLNRLELNVLIPQQQTCCGALHRHNGEIEKAEKLAKQNIMAFAANSVSAILTTSSGCGASLKNYDQWLDGEQLSYPVMDISHYLFEILKTNKQQFKPLPLTVALHSPCTLRQHADQQQAVSELLALVPELTILPLSEQTRCCGAGGNQMLTQPEIADSLGDDIVDEVRTMNPDILISSNLGCALHLKSRLKQSELSIPLLHPVEIVARSLSI